MKKLMLIVASLFLATSVASANQLQKMDLASMNKADSQFLFDGSTKVIALSSQEMKQTEGEWINFAIYAGYRGYQAYRGWGRVSKIWYPVSFGWGSSRAW